jgi:hypothetical protein
MKFKTIVLALFILLFSFSIVYAGDMNTVTDETHSSKSTSGQIETNDMTKDNDIISGGNSDSSTNQTGDTVTKGSGSSANGQVDVNAGNKEVDVNMDNNGSKSGGTVPTSGTHDTDSTKTTKTTPGSETPGSSKTGNIPGSETDPGSKTPGSWSLNKKPGKKSKPGDGEPIPGKSDSGTPGSETPGSSSTGKEPGMPGSEAPGSDPTSKLTKEEIDQLWWDSIQGEKAKDKISEYLGHFEEGKDTEYVFGALDDANSALIDIKKEKSDRVWRLDKIIRYDWDFKNLDTLKSWTHQTSSEKLKWKFTETGDYKVVSKPWCKWDVGHWETYYVTVTEADGTKHEQKKKKWVHEEYVNDYWDSHISTYNFTISIYDLNKEIQFPIEKQVEVEAFDELVM